MRTSSQKTALPIRTRLTLWYVSLLALLLLGFSGALYFLVARALYQQVDDTLIHSAGQLAFETEPTAGQPLTVSTFVVDPATINVVRGGEIQGTQFLTNAKTADILESPVAIAVKSLAWQKMPENVTFSTVVNQGQAYRIYNSSGSTPLGEQSFQVVSSLTPVETTLQQLALALGLVVPTTLGAAALGGMWFARRALAPVDRITRAAQELSAHDLHQRLELDLPDDEVGRLANTFDDMLARLEQAFARESEFTSNASHELRTPLTVMRGEIQVALTHERTPMEYASVLQRLDADVQRMSDTVSELLLLARADVSRLEGKSEPLEAALILETVGAAWTSFAETKEVTLRVGAPPALMLRGNESYLIRALGNLVENAIKFSDEGSEVSLSATRDRNEVVFVIADEGTGIPAQQLPHVLERFYRADDGRVAGTGLGLPLAQALIAAQGGTLKISSEAGHGTRAEVRMRVL